MATARGTDTDPKANILSPKSRALKSALERLKLTQERLDKTETRLQQVIQLNKDLLESNESLQRSSADIVSSLHAEQLLFEENQTAYKQQIATLYSVMKAETAAHEKRIEAAKLHIESLQKELEERKLFAEAYHNLLASYELLKPQYSAMQESLRQQMEMVTKLRGQLASLIESTKVLDSALTQQKAENARVEAALAAERSNKATLEAGYIARCTELQSTLDTMVVEKADLQQRLAERETRDRAGSATLSTISDNSTSTQLAHSKHKVASLKGELRKARSLVKSAVGAHAAETGELKSEIAHLRAQLSEAHTQIHRMQLAMADMHGHISAGQSQVSYYQNQSAELWHWQKQLQVQLQGLTQYCTQLQAANVMTAAQAAFLMSFVSSITMPQSGLAPGALPYSEAVPSIMAADESVSTSGSVLTATGVVDQASDEESRELPTAQTATVLAPGSIGDVAHSEVRTEPNRSQATADSTQTPA